MKKLICILCVMLALMCAFVACNGSDTSDDDDNVTTTSKENTSKETQSETQATVTEATSGEITDVTTDEAGEDASETTTENGTEDVIFKDGYVNVEDIVLSSAYSEGLAVVNLKSEKNIAYVIDKSGKIIFSFELEEESAYRPYTVRNMAFQKGLLVYNGICYDKTGRVILPESAGVTSFLEIADGEYIIAEKVVADYANAKKELGVMNMNFEWIVPLGEGAYNLYYSNSIRAHEFFWEEVVRSKDDVIKAFQFDEYSPNDGVYLSNGTVLTPENTNVVEFLGVYEGKYILAMATQSTVGVMNLNGVWLLEPTNDLLMLYRHAHIEIENDVFSAKNEDVVVYYDFATKTTYSYEKNQLISDYCNGAAVTEVHGGYDDEGYHVDEILFGDVDTNAINEFEFYSSENDKYILVRANQGVMLKGENYGEYVEYEEFMDVYAVIGRDSKWIVKGILGYVEIKGDYLCVSGDFENGYYNLITGEFSEQKPADFPEDDEDDWGDDENDDDLGNNAGFDITQITNYYKSTDFVNGKAAVALWNGDARKMYMTIVDTDGEFVFTPVEINANTMVLFPLYFDGEYVVVADNDGCGTGYIESYLTLYTYNLNGELVAQWKASDELQCYNCSFV